MHFFFFFFFFFHSLSSPTNKKIAYVYIILVVYIITLQSFWPSAMATDRILGFLQFGDDPSFFDTLPPSSLSPFLPSLAVLSSVSPSLASHLLGPLVSHPQCPTALSYASLDFSSISSDVQRMEKEDEVNRAPASEKSRAGGAEEVSFEGSYSGNGLNINSFSLLSGGPSSSSSPSASSSAMAFRMDESLQFEWADEVRLFIEEKKPFSPWK